MDTPVDHADEELDAFLETLLPAPHGSCEGVTQQGNGTVSAPSVISTGGAGKVNGFPRRNGQANGTGGPQWGQGWSGLAGSASPLHPGTAPQIASGFGPTRSFNPSKISFSKIPHRQFLYGLDLVRGELTVLASPGGVGKTSYAVAVSIAAATGRRLLDDKIFGGPLRVLYINAEDNRVEMLRRVWAFCLKHRVFEHELSDLSLLGADDWQVHQLSFLRAEKSVSVLHQESLDHLETLLEVIRPDIVVLDPLVALCGGGNINDNSAMSLVMRALKRLANRSRCAMLILHHNKKGGDGADAESISGAAAIVNLARRALMAIPMGSEEAKALFVLPSECGAYFKVVPSKSNLAPRSADAVWYRLCNVTLPNPEPPTYLNGDGVQAVARVQLPLQPTSGTTAEEGAIKQVILDTVSAGKIVDGKTVPYSPNVTGARNLRGLLEDAVTAARRVMKQPRPPEDIRAIIERCVGSLKSEGALVEETVASGRFRGSQGLRVDPARVPPKPNPSLATSSANGSGQSGQKEDREANADGVGAMEQCHEQ